MTVTVFRVGWRAQSAVMASNPVPPEPAVGDDDQPAEGASAAATLTVEVTVVSHGVAGGGSDSARFGTSNGR